VQDPLAELAGVFLPGSQGAGPGADPAGRGRAGRRQRLPPITGPRAPADLIRRPSSSRPEPVQLPATWHQ